MVYLVYVFFINIQNAPHHKSVFINWEHQHGKISCRDNDDLRNTPIAHLLCIPVYILYLIRGMVNSFIPHGTLQITQYHVKSIYCCVKCSYERDCNCLASSSTFEKNYIAPDLQSMQ